MNKGLEVIEAHHLFSMPYEKIEVVVQPQSAIHSMVEFSDGSVKAHLGTTDMRIPIQFALSYPQRWEAPVAPLDFRTLGTLEFAAPDTDTFRCLALARQAGEIGGTLPCVMNAANEVAVAAFLAEQLPYLGIAECVEDAMEVLGTPAGGKPRPASRHRCSLPRPRPPVCSRAISALKPIPLRRKDNAGLMDGRRRGRAGACATTE